MNSIVKKVSNFINKRAYLKYLLKKSVWYIITFIFAVTLNFVLPRLIEGDPVSRLIAKMTAGTGSDDFKAIRDNFAKEFGLDKPIIIQYFIYWKNLFSGNLGTSFSMYPREVSNILSSAVPWSVALMLPAVIIGWLIGNILGAISAYIKGIFDRILLPISLIFSSAPFYAFSIIFLYIFALKLKWFPTGGGYSITMLPNFSFDFVVSLIQHYTLPFLSIVVVTIGGQAIGMREMSIYELNSDYVLYSKLSGIKDRKIVRYVFKNAMLPQITGLALSLGTIVGGSLITEIVFNYPGIGTTIFTAIRNFDYPLISGSTLLITIFVLLANFSIDLIYAFIDPRIKSAQMEEV
ncbi:MAG: ABC transporter permease [Clostridiales bacterium]